MHTHSLKWSLKGDYYYKILIQYYYIPLCGNAQPFLSLAYAETEKNQFY